MSKKKTFKVGARNSSGDAGRLQQIHDLSVENGANCAAKSRRAVKAANMADYVEASLHRDFTVMADIMLMQGQLNRAERIALSNAIGDALSVLHEAIVTNLPQLAKRPPDGQAPEAEGEEEEETPAAEEMPEEEQGSGEEEEMAEDDAAEETPTNETAAEEPPAGEKDPNKKSFTAKALSLAYIKHYRPTQAEQFFKDVLAAKLVGNSGRLRSYINLWGSAKLADLELEYFTPQTDFWDGVLGLPRPLTWDHAQDATMKARPIIGQMEQFGDDDIGRWYEAQLDRKHRYFRAISNLVSERALGTSSDSAPQYVERQRTGKATWLKTWPLFAAALTTTPCEPRMLGQAHWKALGIDLQSQGAEAAQEALRAELAARVATGQRLERELKLYSDL